MTEINFYVSKEQGLEHRLAIVYRLIHLARQRNLQIHVHTDSEATSTKLDDYLWSKETTSFIPHSIISDNTASNSSSSPNNVNKNSINQHSTPANTDIQSKQNINQINISHDFEPLTTCDYLINLSTERPNFFSRFLKVAEILDNDEEIITAGRKRYSFYRDRGYTLGYYKL